MSPRIVSGIVMAVVAALLIIFLPASIFKLLILIIVFIGAKELSRMILPVHPTSSSTFVIVLSVVCAAVIMFFSYRSHTLIFALALSVIASFSFYLFRQHALNLVLSQISHTLLAVLYIGVMPAFLGLVRDLPDGSAWIFLLLSTTFGADTAAYFSGRFLGRHKLAPRVSPGKTVEGVVGGIVGSVLVGLLCRVLFFHFFTIADCIWVGLIAGVIGPIGDLSESLIKRSVGFKDSGNLIPGHGGILDRVDALLFVAPFVYSYAVYVR